MNEWISVEDRMPERCTNVLIHVINPSEILVAYLSYSGDFCYDRDDEGEEISTKATHWQPLPEPPQ